jgi:23S rRNA pseudouridine2605 synthase
MSKERKPAERIQKALARQGVASRRQIETLIADGKLLLNGKKVVAGDQVSAGDVVMLDGKKIVIRNDDDQLPRVIAYHKPEGEICSRNDPQGRPTIFDRLPRIVHSRWVAIGRLDINTAGLILLTDNGELANKLMHPSSQVEREYIVRTLGMATQDMMKQLVNKVELEDGPARFEEVTYVGGGEGVNHWYHVTIMEGRNREVRRMWDAVGLQVSRLKRVRYGTVTLASTHRQGAVKELTEKAVIELAASVGINYSKNRHDDAAPKRSKTRVVMARPEGKASGRGDSKTAVSSRGSTVGRRPPRGGSTTAKTKRRS